MRNIHYGDIHKGLGASFRLSDETVPFVDEELARTLSGDAYCEPGDVVLADASEDVADIGKAIEIVEIGGERLVAGLHTILASQIEQRLIVGFSAYLFASRPVRKQIQERAQGAKVLGISKSQLAEVAIPFPQYEYEQQKIADCLSSLDDLIRAEGARLGALRDHKRALMQRLFPRPGETTPRLRFPDFRDAGPWEVKRLGEIGTILKGKGIAKSDVKPDGSLPCIRYGELYTIYGETISDVVSRTDADAADLVLSEEGDVIIPASGETKKDIATASCLAKAGVALGSDLNVFRSSLSGSFLAYYIRGNLKPLISKVAQGDSVVHLYPAQLEKLQIATPTSPEQQKIAACLTALDDLIRAQGERIEALRSHKRGLMQQLFPQDIG